MTQTSLPASVSPSNLLHQRIHKLLPTNRPHMLLDASPLLPFFVCWGTTPLRNHPREQRKRIRYDPLQPTPHPPDRVWSQHHLPLVNTRTKPLEELDSKGTCGGRGGEDEACISSSLASIPLPSPERSPRVSRSEAKRCTNHRRNQPYAPTPPKPSHTLAEWPNLSSQTALHPVRGRHGISP